jgi:hypothetical protein
MINENEIIIWILVLLIIITVAIVIYREKSESLAKYRKIGSAESSPPRYPFKKNFTTDSEIKDRFARLSGYTPELNSYHYKIRNIKEIQDNMLLYNGDYLLVDSSLENYDKYDNISDYFAEEVRVKCKRSDQSLSSFDFWSQNYRKVIKEASEQGTNPREALFKMHYECTGFKPSLMVAFSKLFDSKRVLDISSGWGDRLIGAMASPNVEYYLGADPNSALQPCYSQMVDFFGKNPTDYKVIDSTFQDLDLSDEDEFDLVLTSPPYFDLEEYTTDTELAKKQSYKEFDSLDVWLTEFLIPCMRKAFGKLKTGGHMVININDAPNRPPYVRRMIHLATQFPGAIYLGCIAQHDKLAFKKSPQPFWIWQKVGDLPTLDSYNPQVVISEQNGFKVIREDYLLGGTKQRGAVDLYQKISENEFVYPGPNTGFAQIALAIGAKLTGKKATLFVAKSRPMTKQTMQAIRLGANVIECRPNAPLREVREKAAAYIAKSGAASAKLGFDDTVFKDALKRNIAEAVKGTELENRDKARRFWVVGGSAVLARLMYEIFPKSKFNVVQVGKLIDELLDYSKSKLYVAPEKFYDDARETPPYPSVASYDAKVWQFARKDGKKGDFIWNVAKDPELHSDLSHIEEIKREKRGGAADMAKIENEYRRYGYVKRILELFDGFPEKAKTEKNRYEFRNTIERWLLSIANFSDGKFDPVFSDDAMDEKSRFNRQIVHEIIDKSILSRSLAEKLVKDIVKIVSEYKSVCGTPLRSKPGKLKIGYNKVVYKEYSREINHDRIEFLRSAGTDAEIGVMVMRYASILPGSQHWNMPVENYQLYYDQGVRVEGFSSPINSQLITIDPDNCRFCSLFPDVDAPFGSIGNFFDVSYTDKIVAVGPPYTVELFDRISKKVISECEKARNAGKKVMFYITFSAWEDTEGFNSIKNSEFCHFAAIIEKFNHYYINTNDVKLPRVTASFDTVFFVMSYGHDRKPDGEYLEMVSAMTINREKQHRVLKSTEAKKK